MERLRRSRFVALCVELSHTEFTEFFACVICGKTFVCVGGVQRLRRRSWLVRDLPHNCVRMRSLHYGVKFQ
ncbi:MAG: hypothetical protein RR938_08325, partial [Muribaculaceae bacterium]